MKRVLLPILMGVYRTLPVFIAVLFWFLLGAPSQVNADFKLDANTEKQINQLTEELLTGLRRYTEKISQSPLKKIRIALLPFQKNKIPLGKEIADQFNQTLMYGLMARGGKRYVFLAREDLKFIIDNLEATGRLDNSRGDPIASLLRDAGQVDIIIKGKIRRHERKISFSYTAVGLLDGEIAGQTKPVSFYLPDHELTRKSRLLTLDQAVNEAAKKLKENARDLQELRLGGIRYQDTGLQTEFARFLQDKLQSALANLYSEGLSGGRVKVVEPELKWTAAGNALRDKDLRDEMQTDSNFSYFLKGTYWVLEDSIELNLNLENRKRHAAFWNGSMRIEETRGLTYRPTVTAKKTPTYNPEHLKRLKETNSCIRCDLKGANLKGANLKGANLRRANLYEAVLSGAYLQGANLRNANLEGATLQGATLQGANLNGANLQGAKLKGAKLKGADLRRAKLDPEGIKGVQATSSATVREVFVKRGQKIKKGQLIVLLDSTVATADLKGNTEKLNAASGRLTRLKLEQSLIISGKSIPAGSGLNPLALDILSKKLGQYRSKISSFSSKLRKIGKEISTARGDVKSAQKTVAITKKKFEQKKKIEDARRKLYESKHGAMLTYLQAQDATLAARRAYFGAVDAVESKKAALSAKLSDRGTLKADKGEFVAKWSSGLGENLAKEQEALIQLKQSGLKFSQSVDNVEVRAPAEGIVLDVPAISEGSIVRQGDVLVTLVLSNQPIANVSGAINIPEPVVVAKKTPKVTPKRKPVQKVAKRPDDIAVIIANSNYTKLGKDIPNVTPAYNDAENIKKYFMESLGVREGNIIYLKDATGAQLTEVFGNKENHKAQLFDWVRPNKSNVHIYYAGHGAPASKDGSAYLVPSDAKSQKIEFSGYLLTNLYRNLNKIRARSVTVILEACFSGFSQGGAVLPRSSGIMVVARQPTVPSNVRVISAGAADQMASWEQNGSQSLFTKYFLKGMSGEGDKKPYGNGDGKVENRELKKYLDDTMTYYARRYYGRDQTAQIVVNGKELSPTN